MTGVFDSQPDDILIVDDNLLDARATIRATTKLVHPAVAHHRTDGASALEFMMDPSLENPRPDLVLLDLNLPGINGLDVLRWMATDQHVGDVPVVILTTSDHQYDIDRATEFGATDYLTKPFDLDGWGPILPRLDHLLALGRSAQLREGR